MSGPGPWHREPAGDPGSSGKGFLVRLALILAGALGIWELSRLFPGALSTPTDRGYFFNGCVLLALMASGIAYSRRINAGETIRNIAIWAGVVVALGFVYIAYHRFHDVAADAVSELVPGYPVSVRAGEMVLTENRDGDFEVIGAVNGVPVRFLVDTGASEIVLSPADAERAGIDLGRLHFNRAYETANGEGRGAAVTVDHLDIGQVRLVNVPVAVNGARMSASLLGMSFLRRMKSFEMKGRKLYLRWR